MEHAAWHDHDWLAQHTTGAMLRAGAFGIEREALRVKADGTLALTPHPQAFGDKLENARVTVDFSESQLELITPPCPTVEDALLNLRSIQDEVEGVLRGQDEHLWPMSMPTSLPEESQIPIAHFVDTPEGRRRELYRVGLANRYGRRMQMISGIHFNFSFGAPLLALLQQKSVAATAREYMDAAYFRTARNFLRNRWLLVWLSGASPAADASFGGVVRQQVQTVKACCRGCKAFVDEHKAHATSLRVSRYGYADTAFSDMPVSFNSLSEYTRDIRALMHTPSEKFAQIGLDPQGQPLQINSNVLQSESEFYSAIRLKGRIRPNEGHLDAMERDGVYYAEVRVLDLNPFAPEAIDLLTLRFIQVLMLDCLLGPDTPIHSEEWATLQENHHRVALSGRNPELPLCTGHEKVLMRELATDILTRLRNLARLMDRGAASPDFENAIEWAQGQLVHPEALPSARIWSEMQALGMGHVAYGARFLHAVAHPAACAADSVAML
ncbi:glutamate--cysteine ligase [Uliginosibacterium gangwonense]|uniref:glutamate--cysteine ligase n=1 Tax=Uliginosibacterium gangwonense TaxID=392736 RepID=UPI00068598FD|nr:glutamate--cysteine ligase [Uliginosibacterium gangwonense]